MNGWLWLIATLIILVAAAVYYYETGSGQGVFSSGKEAPVKIVKPPRQSE